MALGTTVKIERPFGNLTLHNNTARAAVFLAGGIGNYTLSKHSFLGREGEVG